MDNLDQIIQGLVLVLDCLRDIHLDYLVIRDIELGNFNEIRDKMFFKGFLFLATCFNTMDEVWIVESLALDNSVESNVVSWEDLVIDGKAGKRTTRCAVSC